MGRWKSEEERLELGARAAYLREVEKLGWTQIAERLSLHNGIHAKRYYEAYKTSLLTAKSRMTLKQIEEFSRQHNIEPGWVWLYENGFKRRVPQEVRGEIETAKERSC